MDTHALEALTGLTAAPTGRENANPLAAQEEIDLQQAVVIFVAQRPRLIKIAYRILGNAGEAEEVVQEVWLRWQNTDRHVINNPPGFLATATSRLAINVLQSARTRHEAAGTPWLEHLVDPVVDLETTAERTEVVELAIGVLLERLNPAERAAYLLRKGFDYPYGQVAAVLHLSPPNARQLVSRAHARIHSARHRPVNIDTHRRLVRAVVTAAHDGEFTELEALLAADIGRNAA